MRKLALLCVLMATAAWAGETLVGVIVITDGGTGTNYSAGATAAAPTTFISSTKCNVGFEIGAPSSFITVQTDEGCFVGVDVVGCDAGQCLKLAADEKFPTSVKKKITFSDPSWNWDGGSQATPCTASHAGTRVAVAPPVGGTACHAKVFTYIP